MTVARRQQAPELQVALEPGIGILLLHAGQAVMEAESWGLLQLRCSVTLECPTKASCATNDSASLGALEWL